jgi:hypothetical protein
MGIRWCCGVHEDVAPNPARRTVVDAGDEYAGGEDQDAAALGVQAVHAVHVGRYLVVAQRQGLGVGGGGT